jgi:hypothetical protein
MAYPGVPTHVHDKYRYGMEDPEVSTWYLLERRSDGSWHIIGWIFDDTTPDLYTKWVPLALQLAPARGYIVVVLVGPGNMGKHHPGCYAWLEAYWKCAGVTLRQYIGQIVRHPRNHYSGYVMMKNYGWQDNGGGPQCVPTPRQYWIMRHALAALRPKFGLWDF